MSGVKKHLIFTLILPGFIVLFNLNVRAENYNYYVSPEGNDSWEGSTPDRPFATIQKARDVIRKINKKEGTITVYLGEGEYRLAETFTLRPEDSGTRSCPVNYTAMPGENPIIIGDGSVGDGVLGQLMLLLGAPEKDKYVEHINITGITFAGKGIPAADDSYTSDRLSGLSSLVALEYVHNCSFRDNSIINSQIPALQIYGDDIAVSDNKISDVKGGAIHIKGNRFIVSDNFINDIYLTDEHVRPGWGICLDITTSEANVVNNIIARAGIGLWMKGQNRNISIRNNILVNPDLSLVKLSNPANKNHEHIRLSRNVFYYRNYDVDIFNISGKRSLPEVSDNNIFWNPTACLLTSKVIRGIGPATGFAEWQSLGFDTHSLVENPLFVDMENDNYALKKESKAFETGFIEIKKPNIIFIMSDDHAAHALGSYGGRLAELNPTPNLDQLAAGGFLFKNAFCTNSICTPSRATILTGQYSQTNGVLDLDGYLPPEKQFLPMELKRLGYSTAVIGKWHLVREPAVFDYYKVLPVQGNYFDPVFREKGRGEWPDNLVETKGHSSDVITDLAIDYLKNRDKSKPFFLMHHFKAPHGPFSFAPRYADYLEDVHIPEPSSMYSQPDFGSDATRGRNDSLLHFIGTSVSNRHMTRNNEKYAHLPEDEATSLKYQSYLKSYLRCVKGVDDNIGRLCDYLKEEGLWDNTVIIYTGDQGMMLGEHDYVDKRWMYEESMRMPFIVHYPDGIKPGGQSDILINNSDYAPTMIELAGGTVPEYMQGRSFKNTLEGKPEVDWRTATYYRYWMHIIHHYVPAHFGIRTKDYKLIFYYSAHYLPPEEFMNFYWDKRFGKHTDPPSPSAWEFYDLSIDPEELHNRYEDPEYADIIASLKVELKKQREELNETDVNFPKLQKIIEENWDK